MRTIAAILALVTAATVAMKAHAATRFYPGKNPEGCTLKVEDPVEYRGRKTVGLTDELKKIILEKKRAAGCPDRCDLDATYIERTPRYHRYYVSYGPGGTSPYLEGAQVRMQRWPLEGQVVTFYGHIVNKGLQPSVETTWVMTLDGKPIGQGKVPALKPLDEYIVSAKWPWRTGRHQVRLHFSGPCATRCTPSRTPFATSTGRTRRRTGTARSWSG
jgi:hypothetical protein